MFVVVAVGVGVVVRVGPFRDHLGLVWGGGRAPALGRLGPGSRRGCVGRGPDKGKPALSRRRGVRSSGHERKEDAPAEGCGGFVISGNPKM